MKSRRVVFLVALGAVALLATGCQWARWLRLLSLKKQLAKVERYVRVEDRGGLTLHFLKPVVYCDDLSLLVADETLRTTNGNHVTWLWTYEKQSAGTNAEPGNYDLSFTILFEDLKLSELRFSEKFLTVMPKPLIVGLLRSVRQAEVDIRHGTVKMKWVGPGANQKVELPTKDQVTTLLGAPFLISGSNGVQTYLYMFYQKVPEPRPPAERLGWAEFAFTGGGEEIASSQLGRGFQWNITYENARFSDPSIVPALAGDPPRGRHLRHAQSG